MLEERDTKESKMFLKHSLHVYNIPGTVIEIKVVFISTVLDEFTKVVQV